MNNTKPKISIFGSACRPQNWMDFYKSIGDNHVEFEVVFAGPNPPDYELPKNFRFIRSFVKPTQCLEIACRNTVADLVINVSDDCEFRGPRPLDRLYETYKNYNNEKILLSCRLSTNGVDESHFAHRFYISDSDSPLMPVSALMSKKLFKDLGGIDSSFIAVMWDCDIAMRVYAAGGRVILSDVIINEDRIKIHSCLWEEFCAHDRGLLERLWTTNGKLHLNRENPVESFSDINILTASQGPRGRWRGKGPIIFDKAEDFISRCGLIFGRINRGIRKPSKYLEYGKRIALRLKGN